MISLVMLAWRTRFMYSVSVSIMSAAFVVAASMAVMRARVLGGGRFQQRAVELHLDVARQQVVEHLAPAAARRCNRPAACVCSRQLDAAAAARRVSVLRDHDLEFVVDEVDRVDLVVAIQSRSALRAISRASSYDDAWQPADVLAGSDRAALAEEIAALAADRHAARRARQLCSR